MTWQQKIPDCMQQPIIDSHLHIWDFSKARYTWLENNTTLLARNYAIEELEPERQKAGITGGVLVQAANNGEDTDWMLEVAAATDWIHGVVGWLPLTDPQQTEKLLVEKYLSNHYFTGVRHLIHDEQNPQWLLQDTVLESLAVLARHQVTYDVVGVLPEHIETVLKVADRVPRLKMIFDHLNQPPVATGEKFGRWGELMKEAAQHYNFFTKISGLGLTCKAGNDWTADMIKPYIQFVLENFGEDRCCCGGDWPVCLLAGSYSGTWQKYTQVLNEILGTNAINKVLHDTAKSFYHL